MLCAFCSALVGFCVASRKKMDLVQEVLTAVIIGVHILALQSVWLPRV